MKTEDGITMVSLVLTIALMLILASVTVNIGIGMIDKVKEQEMITEIETLQTAMETIEAPPEYKNSNDYISYTADNLKTYFNVTGISNNAEINWKLKKVRMSYKGQYIYSQNYEVEKNNQRNIDFSISVVKEDNRYKVEINNLTNFESTYRNSSCI